MLHRKENPSAGAQMQLAVDVNRSMGSAVATERERNLWVLCFSDDAELQKLWPRVGSLAFATDSVPPSPEFVTTARQVIQRASRKFQPNISYKCTVRT